MFILENFRLSKLIEPRDYEVAIEELLTFEQNAKEEIESLKKKIEELNRIVSEQSLANSAGDTSEKTFLTGESVC
jgi:hypothetical protein